MLHLRTLVLVLPGLTRTNLLFDNMASYVEGTGKSFLLVCSEDHLPSVPSPDDWYMRF